MERRSFFGILFGGLFCKFLPKPIQRPGQARIEDFAACYPIITEMENVKFDGPVLRSIDQSKPARFTVVYVTRNGYVTAPAPYAKLLDIPRVRFK